MTTSAIEVVLLHYFPGWDAPDDAAEWNACICPAHDEDRPSCRVSFSLGAIRCLACGFGGDVVSIVRQREEVSYPEAVRRAEAILVAGGCDLPASPSRKPGGRAARRKRPRRGDGAIRPWLRS